MSVRVGTTGRALTAYGGAELPRETARALGLAEEVAAAVSVKERARGLSEAQFVVGAVESIALGARCLDDLAVARADAAQEQLRGFAVPAPQTAGTWLRRFTLGHLGQLNKALEAVQRRTFTLAGVEEVTLDFDSTYLFSRSTRRQGVDRTYKKGYALHPLLCFDAASAAAVHARLRRGRAGTSTGMATLIVEAVCAIGEEFWSPCVNKDEGEVAEFGYRLRDGRVFRRYVVKRIEIAPGEQATLEEGGFRYWVSVTNDRTRIAAGKRLLDPQRPS